MSAPEAPATTDIQQVLLNQEMILAQQTAMIGAINSLGQNVQWIIDNVQGVFQMFSNPQFMAQLPNVMGGMASGGSE